MDKNQKFLLKQLGICVGITAIIVIFFGITNIIDEKYERLVFAIPTLYMIPINYIYLHSLIGNIAKKYILYYTILAMSLL